MCDVCGGITGHGYIWENTERQGQCSRCHIGIYPHMLCGIEEGRLVCGARVRDKKLMELQYGQTVLTLLNIVQFVYCSKLSLSKMRIFCALSA